MNTNSANSAYEKNEKTVDNILKLLKKSFQYTERGKRDI